MPEDQITDYIPFDGNFYRFRPDASWIEGRCGRPCR